MVIRAGQELGSPAVQVAAPVSVLPAAAAVQVVLRWKYERLPRC